jgi:multimeric flavodoxin WrbA
MPDDEQGGARSDEDAGAAAAPGPSVVAIIGSPRAHGNAAAAVATATAELERRGIRCETLPLCQYLIEPCRGHENCGTRRSCPVEDDAEEVYEKVYAADGLILATPVYFANVSAQMKAFMDRTNHRYLHGPPLAPRVAGLIAIGGQGGLKSTIAAMQRFLMISCPTPPAIEAVTGIAEKAGAARRSEQLREDLLEMARRMADVLLSPR